MTRKRSGPKPATRRPTTGSATSPAPSEASTAADAPSNQPRTEASPDAPITGVASGSLGTAANLDDTQVMRTADLERAVAELTVPAWLTDDPPPLPSVLEQARGRALDPKPEHVQPRQRVKPALRAGSSASGGRRTSVLAGAVAGALLVLVVGAAMLGATGGFGANPAAGGPALGDPTQAPVATPSPEPSKEGKGCHGKGKGNDCKD